MDIGIYAVAGYYCDFMNITRLHSSMAGWVGLKEVQIDDGLPPWDSEKVRIMVLLIVFYISNNNYSSNVPSYYCSCVYVYFQCITLEAWYISHGANDSH